MTLVNICALQCWLSERARQGFGDVGGTLFAIDVQHLQIPSIVFVVSVPAT